MNSKSPTKAEICNNSESFNRYPREIIEERWEFKGKGFLSWFINAVFCRRRVIF